MSKRKGVEMHLIVDGFGGNREMLESEELVYQLLEHYPAQIGMNKVAPPYVFKYIGSKPEDWGVSGFVLIAESHISIHTFPERCYVNIDVFSCKDFDSEKVLRDVQSWFELTDMNSYLLNRGLEYSHGEYSVLEMAEPGRI